MSGGGKWSVGRSFFNISYSSGSIAEAQEWEYKLIEVQDWLAEKDILLTSHLEQELTVEDLPEESQVISVRSKTKTTSIAVS